VIVTAIFGLFGLIPAAIATSEARQIGQPTGRYWAAFGWTLVVEVLLAVALFLVVAGAVVSAGS
jgi:hypothetical protein